MAIYLLRGTKAMFLTSKKNLQNVKLSTEKCSQNSKASRQSTVSLEPSVRLKTPLNLWMIKNLGQSDGQTRPLWNPMSQTLPSEETILPS